MQTATLDDTKKDDKKPKTLAELKTLAAKMKPVTPPPGYILSAAPSPSALHQIRDAVANSAIGHSIESTMPKVADALHLHPSETVNSPTYEQHKEQLLAPEYLTPAATKLADAVSFVPLSQADKERTEGALTAAGGFTTAPGVLMAAAGPLAVPESAAGVVLSRLVSGGFTLDMLNGLYQQNKEYKKAVDSGNLSEAHKIQGEMGVTGIMALLTGKHALTKHSFTPVDEIPDRARTNVVHRNTAGEVRQAKGQSPTVWLSPSAWNSFMGILYPGEDPNATHGVNLPANEHLQSFANDHSLAASNPAIGDVQNLLSEAHKNAGEGGIAVGKQRPSIQSNVNVMREELNHTWQRSLANGNVINHLKPEAFESLHKAIPRGMQDHLIEQGYDGTSAPEMVTETAAKLMDGRPERFGVTPDQAVNFLDSYFKEVTAQHGTKALEELQHVRGIAADAKARAIAEHSGAATGYGGEPIRSLAEGGQGGITQGVPAFNQGKLENWIHHGAEEYAKGKGLGDVNLSRYHLPDFRAKEIADAYESMKHDPENPEVAASYKALQKEIADQYNFATKKMGITMEPWKGGGQPYANSSEMVNDVRNNKHLYFFRGGEMPTNHPLSGDAGDDLTYNDKLRAVHDLFGHAMGAFEFGPRGEENAWNEHRQMFSDEAIPALTTETKGQNSWVNYGPQMRDSNGRILGANEPGWLAPKDRAYAEQKAGLLPKRYYSRMVPGEIFSSPNRSDMGLEEAIKKTGDADTQKFIDVARDVEAKYGINMEHFPTTAMWKGGAEPSVLSRSANDMDMDALRAVAALRGKLADQNAVLTWHSDPDGPQLRYAIHMPGIDTKEAYNLAKNAGLGKFTVETHQNGSILHIIETSDDPAVQKELGDLIGEHFGQYQIDDTRGYGTLLTKEAPATGRDNSYDSILKNYQDGSRDSQGRAIRAGELDNPTSQGDGGVVFNREKEKPTWYLKSERLIDQKMKGPQSAEDVYKMLISGGVKPEEMQWTGLDDFLKSKGKDKVTPEEIREHLANNNIQINEVTKGVREDGSVSPDRLNELAYGMYTDSYANLTEEEKENVRENADWDNIKTDTKYGIYQLPGGTNYKELLLTLPVADAPPSWTTKINPEETEYAGNEIRDVIDAHGRVRATLPAEEIGAYLRHETQQDRSNNPQPFISNHWDEPNVLAHVRMNDRVTPSGDKLLHIEELQSDMHQTGRKNGYQGDYENQPLEADRNGPSGVWQVYTKDGRFVTNVQDTRLTEDEAIAEARRRMKEEPHRTSVRDLVPDAPFKKDWQEMALRRIIKHAVDNGYSAVSWTPGAEQNARYSLSKQVNKIAVPMVNTDGSRSVRIDPLGEGHNSFKMMVSPDGTVEGYHGASQFTGKKLDEVIGKDIAKKVMEANEPTEFSGKGLEVGGSGQKGFYDKIVPDYLNKFGKKFNAKVGAVDVQTRNAPSPETINKIQSQVQKDPRLGTMPLYAHMYGVDEDYVIDGIGDTGNAGETTYKIADRDGNLLDNFKGGKSVQYLPITPEMRKSIAEEGVPLFSKEKPDNPTEDEPKFSYGNTQAAIPKGSAAHTAILALQNKVKDDDLAGKGKDVDEPHVTVRYGIKSKDIDGIRKYIESQAPFDAKLGKTEIFPPSKSSDGAAVINAPVVSDELNRMNEEIQHHGDFKESDFQDYKPHVTIAYINPEAADKYKDMHDAEGKTFRISSIDISDQDGDKENVQLKGIPKNSGGTLAVPIKNTIAPIAKKEEEPATLGAALAAETERTRNPRILSVREAMAEAKRMKPRKMAVFTPKEDSRWETVFIDYIEDGYTDEEADKEAWEDMKKEFPRLKDFDGAYPFDGINTTKIQ